MAFSGVFFFRLDSFHWKYVLWESISETMTTETILTAVNLKHGLCMSLHDFDMGYGMISMIWMFDDLFDVVWVFHVSSQVHTYLFHQKRYCIILTYILS